MVEKVNYDSRTSSSHHTKGLFFAGILGANHVLRETVSGQVNHLKVLPIQQARSLLSELMGNEFCLNHPDLIRRSFNVLSAVTDTNPNIIKPDLFMFLYDRFTAQIELERKFHWRKGGITLKQAAGILFALSTGTSIDLIRNELVDNVSSNYPMVGSAIRKSDRLAIPAAFFLERFYCSITPEEGRSIELGVQKYSFSPLEYTVLVLLSRRYSTLEICKILNLKHSGFKTHILSIYGKVQCLKEEKVFDRTQLALMVANEELCPIRILEKRATTLVLSVSN